MDSQSRLSGLRREERLARRVADGDGDAFAAIYERYRRELGAYAHGLVRREHDAGDVLQNALLKAYRALASGTAPRRLKPWLFSIVHNEAISHLRARPESHSLTEEPAAPDDGPEASAELRERLRELVADLGRLPARQRSALLMRELSGLSYAEIATAIGTSSESAKQTVYEARQGLHEARSGREMDCDRVRAAVSARDGRVLKARRLRAHLRECGDCAAFRLAISGRRADLTALAPLLAAGPSAAVALSGLGVAGQPAGAAGTASSAASGLPLPVPAVAVGILAATALAAAGISELGGSNGSQPAPSRSSGAADRGEPAPSRSAKALQAKSTDKPRQAQASTGSPTPKAETPPPVPVSYPTANPLGDGPGPASGPPPTAGQPAPAQPQPRRTPPTSDPTPAPTKPAPSPLAPPAPTAPAAPPPAPVSSECHTLSLPPVTIRVCSGHGSLG